MATTCSSSSTNSSNYVGISDTTASHDSQIRLTSSFLSFDIPGSGPVSVAIERCPLCSGSRRSFYCSSCLNKGLYTHSNGRHTLGCAEKLHTWNDRKTDLLEKIAKIKPILDEKCVIEKKRWEVEHLKEKIRLLKLTLAAEKEALNKDGEKLKGTRRRNHSSQERAKVHMEKKYRILKRCDNIRNRIQVQNATLNKNMDRLVQERRSQTDVLVKFIFPICEIQPNSNSSMELSTVSALKDACQTAYNKGFWEYEDKVPEFQIVNPTLPANGDFSIYHMSVEAKSEVTPDTEPSHHNPAHTISAALCYTTQLVVMLSHILNVTLPRKQSYIDFCRGDMSKKHFNSAVGRLNQNIIHLCLSQGVPSEELTAMSHLQNIQLLLNSTQLGSEGSFEAQADIIQSIEKISLSDDSEDEPELSTDEHDGHFDWERVCYEIPEVDRTGQVASYIPNIATSAGMESQTTAGSIMSTAAASVASLFRAAASHFEHR